MENYEILSDLYDIYELLEAGSGLVARKLDDLITKLEDAG